MARRFKQWQHGDRVEVTRGPQKGQIGVVTNYPSDKNHWGVTIHYEKGWGWDYHRPNSLKRAPEKAVADGA